VSPFPFFSSVLGPVSVFFFFQYLSRELVTDLRPHGLRSSVGYGPWPQRTYLMSPSRTKNSLMRRALSRLPTPLASPSSSFGPRLPSPPHTGCCPRARRLSSCGLPSTGPCSYSPPPTFALAVSFLPHAGPPGISGCSPRLSFVRPVPQ